MIRPRQPARTLLLLALAAAAISPPPPSAEERAKFVTYLSAGGKPDARIEEAIWVLLNTAEFRFNH